MDSYPEDHPNDKPAEQLAQSACIPHAIFGISKHFVEKKPDTAYSGSYHALDPKINKHVDLSF